MINMLAGWKGAVEINGKQYDTVQSAINAFKAVDGTICIKLYPKAQTPRKTDDNAPERVANNTTEVSKPMYRITVKQYMTQKASAGFDFMAKWNNDNPMPMRIMTGWIEKETAGMVYMHLQGMAEATCTCMRCGRPLTNPVSKHYGIGPECMEKLGMVRLDISDIEGITKKLTEVKWAGWVIKSAITDKEEVV